MSWDTTGEINYEFKGHGEATLSFKGTIWLPSDKVEEARKEIEEAIKKYEI